MNASSIENIPEMRLWIQSDLLPQTRRGGVPTIINKEPRESLEGFSAANDRDFEEDMAALLEAITVKRKMYFEYENVPYYCMDAEVSTPTARGGQTLVRLKMRNLLTRAVFDKTFKAGERFKEPDLELVEASYLYSDGEGSHFMDQESFETLTLNSDMMGNALELLVEGVIIQLHKFNGNPIGLQLPEKVELEVVYTEGGARGDTSGNVTKLARLQTGLEIKAPLYIEVGEKVRVFTETREFAGRA